MRQYITHLSKEDFLKIAPNYSLDTSHSSFPQVVAFISDEYPSLPNQKITHINLKAAKHIYSTRDYWEVSTIYDAKRHKIPKRYTDAIYLIEED
jgi:hypothetical protein